MKIILASKFYYRRGGLEAYYFKLTQLLKSHDHDIVPFATNYKENDYSDYQNYFCQYLDLSNIKKNGFNIFKAFKNMFFNREAYQKINKLLQIEKPDIIQGFGVTKHLSASIFKAAKNNNIPTIMRLSDFALLCPNSIGLDGKGLLCKDFDCFSKWNFKAIARKCIQNSLLASFIGFLECKGNKFLDYYKKNIDLFIAPSNFIMCQFIDKYKIDPQKIIYVPVFFDCQDIIPEYNNQKYFLYAGRIESYKGIKTLIDAFAILKDIKLKIVGIGDFLQKAKEYASSKNLELEFLDNQDFTSLKNIIKDSIALIVPSEWYENSPNIILEAYAFGKPVIGSNIGGIPEMIRDKKTGLLFEPGNSDDLAEKIDFLYKNQNLILEYGKNARKILEKEYNSELHYQRLMEVYQQLLKNHIN